MPRHPAGSSTSSIRAALASAPDHLPHPGPPSAAIVAIPGERGAFSEDAARLAHAHVTDLLCLRAPIDVAQAVAEGNATFGVVPLENATAGTVHDTLDALISTPGVSIISDVTVPVQQCVVGVPGASLARLRAIESHPIALAQCRKWITRHPALRPVERGDTAGAAREIALAGDPSRAAIASARAAGIHGLEILARDVQDHPENATRFVVLGRSGTSIVAGHPARTFLSWTPRPVTRSLWRALRPIATMDFEVVRIDSRPSSERWTRHVVLELEHEQGVAGVEALRALLSRRVRALRHLGTFAASARLAGSMT